MAIDVDMCLDQTCKGMGVDNRSFQCSIYTCLIDVYATHTFYRVSQAVLHFASRIGTQIEDSAHMSIYISIYMSVYISIHISIHMSVHMSIHMSLHMSIHMSTCLYTWLCSRTRARLCACPFVHLSILMSILSISRQSSTQRRSCHILIQMLTCSALGSPWVGGCVGT